MQHATDISRSCSSTLKRAQEHIAPINAGRIHLNDPFPLKSIDMPSAG